MNFTIGERLGLLAILPDHGSIVSMLVLRELKAALGLAEKELSAGGVVRLDDGRIKWDPEYTETKVVEIGAAAREIISGLIKDLDTKGQVTESVLHLHERFSEPEGSSPCAPE